MSIDPPEADSIYTMELPDLWKIFTQEYYHGNLGYIGEDKFKKVMWGFDVRFHIKDIIFEMGKESFQKGDGIVISLQQWAQQYGTKGKGVIPLIKHLLEIKRIEKLNKDIERKGLDKKKIEIPKRYYAYTADIYDEIDKRIAYIRHLLIQIYGDKKFVKSMESKEDV